jgi:hypothetical protein
MRLVRNAYEPLHKNALDYHFNAASNTHPPPAGSHAVGKEFIARHALDDELNSLPTHGGVATEQRLFSSVGRS